MKSRDFQLATSGTGLFEQKPAALEPIKLEELAEVLGGKNVQPTKGTSTTKSDGGHCGGLVCWC